MLGDTGQVGIMSVLEGACGLDPGWYQLVGSPASGRRDKEADSASVKSRDWKFAGLPLTGIDIKRKKDSYFLLPSACDSLWQNS